MIEEKVVELNIDKLIPNPYQPRKQFNENSLKELALSIKEYGIINPIIVRPKDDKYEIIAGERRTRAAKLLNMTTVPAIVKNIDDNKMIEIALIENLQRENITPIEEAITYQTILKNTTKTEKELSLVIGKSQAFIANKLRLLKLPENIKNALINRQISERHARSLLTINDEAQQTRLLEKIINEKLSVKELDNLINEQKLTDDEIHQAVNNIISSLDNSEQKEEKESDNMNNGNFFPNFNTGTDANNNPASLNSMNMQTMANNFNYQPEISAAPAAQPTTPIQPEQPPMPTMPEVNTLPQMDVNNIVTPTVTPEVTNPEVNVGMAAPNFSVPTPNFEIPVPNLEVNNNVVNSEVPQNQPSIPEAPIIEEPAPTADIPLFNSEQNQPIPTVASEQPSQPLMDMPSQLNPQENAPLQVEPLLAPVADQPMAEQPVPTMEQPLFNPELTTPSVEMAPPVVETPPVENSFEVPVTTAPTDKFTEVTELLNNNGINYKAYSNDSGHCIIIEI